MHERDNVTPKRRVLIVSYNYPPVGGIGSVRTTKLAKYLPARGWEPTVLTVTRDITKLGRGDPSGGVIKGVKVVRAPFPDLLTYVQRALAGARLVLPGGPGVDTELNLDTAESGSRGGALKGAFGWAKRWASFPDRYQLWFPFALAAGLREIRSGGYSAIYSTSPPVIDHLVASALQRLTGLPWVADFRDPWSQNALWSFTPVKLACARRLERSALARASAITAASTPMAEGLERLHGPRPGGVLEVTSGYDPDDFRDGVQVEEGLFVITFTGRTYGLKMDPSPVLEAVEDLIDSGVVESERVRLRFYGPDSKHLETLRAHLRHPEVLEVMGVVPQSDAILAQQRATALLTIMWDHPYCAMLYGGKVLEYLGARRPVLAWIPAGGVIKELLASTGAGVAAVNRDELKMSLSGWFDEFKECGAVDYRGHSEAVERYRWSEVARRMAEVLDGVTARHGQAVR